MKKVNLLIVAILIAANSFAQKAAIQTAYNYWRYDDLDKAKEAIDQATANESTNQLSKAWYYRGCIYHAIFESTKEQFKSLKPGSLDEAYRAYEKTVELDVKKEYTDDLNKRMSIMTSQFLNEGVDNYRDKKYAEALASFEKSMYINKKFVKSPDTLAIYNAALAAEKSNDSAKAKQYYSDLIGMNYGGAKVYGMLASLQLNDKDTTTALATLKNGRQKFPADADLSITELNIYLSSGRDKDAVQQIDQAIATDSKNPNLYYAKGVLNDKLGNKEVAIDAYKKAIEIKADHFDAHYNLGAMLFNEGAELVSKANNLPVSKQKEYDELKVKFEAKFRDAKPYFEKARQLNASDRATLQNLKQLYTRLNELDKAAEVNRQLDSLK